MLQHLAHGRAGLDHRLRPQPLCQQVAAGVLGQRQVDVGEVVHHLAVELLRDPGVEAAVPGLHVEDRDLAPAGRDDREAGVGVAVEQERVGPLLLHHLVAPGDHLGDHLGHALAAHPEHVAGAGDAELVEEDAVELVVVVLAGVDQHVIGVALQRRQDPGELDDLGPGAHHGHDLEAHERLHVAPGHASSSPPSLDTAWSGIRRCLWSRAAVASRSSTWSAELNSLVRAGGPRWSSSRSSSGSMGRMA